MNPPQLGSYEHIALSAIRPSTTNPRKNFDPAALEELTQSIRALGVTVPILVRPEPMFCVSDGIGPVREVRKLDRNGNPSAVASMIYNSPSAEQNEEDARLWIRDNAPPSKYFEIVTGERRHRAAAAAGLTEIPAVVRDLTDEEAMDLQIVENLQRADLHPVEEAEGYRALMAGGNKSVDDVAKKVGKTAGYVAQRLKLLQLELPAKTLFHVGHLNLGHALLLARLTPADQDRATRDLLGVNHLPKKEDMVAKATEMIEYHTRHNRDSRLIRNTEGDLRRWISSHVSLSLAKASWSLTDALLVPEAGACTTCPKRTGTNAALFADITADEDVCFDGTCFETKRKASELVVIAAAADAGKPLLKLSAKSGHKALGSWTVARTVLRHGQWVIARPKSCPAAAKGILVDAPSGYSSDLQGKKQGDQLTVCADQKCHIHKHTVEKPGASLNGNDPVNRDQREQKEKAYVADESPIRVAIIDEIKAKAEAGLWEIRSAVGAHVREYAYICREMEWEFKDSGKNDWGAKQSAEPVLKDELERADVPTLGHVVLLDALARNLEPTSWRHAERNLDRKALWAIAEHYDIDADAIAAKVQAEAKAKLTPEAKVAAGAKPAKKTVSAEQQKKRKDAAAAKFINKPKGISADAKKRIAENMKKRWDAARAKKAVK